METNAKPMTVGGFLIKLLQGVLIGLGAVLPGISGGVLCVVFGVYAPIMALLSNPFRAFKRYAPTLLPVVIGMGIGFLGVSKVLGILLETYPDASVCLFVGLIVGMLPSLFREARSKGPVSGKDYVGMAIAFAALFALLLILNDLSVEITPNFGWYLFCGFCLAMSVIAPGMSFSTLLMPLGLYTPFVKGIGDFDFDFPVVQRAFTQFLAEDLTGIVTRCGLRIVGRKSEIAWGRYQNVQNPFFRCIDGFGAYLDHFGFTGLLDADIHQIADDGVDIAANVADFREFGRFDLDERCIGQSRQTARDFGFADTGRSDHQNVFRGDFMPEWFGDLLTAPAVTQCNRNGTFGFGLSDDMFVQFGDDLLGSQVHDGFVRKK